MDGFAAKANCPLHLWREDKAVSYTHLDVYKRKAYNSPGNCPFERTGRKHEAVYMNGREVYKFAVNAATNDIIALCSNAGVEPVSYTHLDVYKRQTA